MTDDTTRGGRASGSGPGSAAAALIYLLLALAATWPLARHFGDHVVGWPGDNFEYVWKLWWVETALLERGVWPFFNPDVYFPTGFNLAHAEMTATNTFLLVPVTALFGPVAAYNLAVVGWFVLSGLGTYRLVRRLTGDRWAGLVGGSAFAFCAFRIAHLPGHLPLMSTGFLPFLLLAIEGLLARPTVRGGALAGLCFALTALGSWYLGLATALALPIYLVARGWPLRGRLVALAAVGWRPALAFLVVVLALVAPFALPYYELSRGGMLRQSVRVADYWSASPANFLVPNPLNPLYRLVVPPSFQHEFVERMLYLGLAPLALTAVALRRPTRVVVALAAVALCFLVLALGTTLRLGGDTVLVPVPPAVAERFYRGLGFLAERSPFYGQPYDPIAPGAVNLPMPALALYLLTPFFSSMRTLGRMAVIAMLALAVLAGIGFSHLGWRGRARAGLALALTLFVAFESYIPYELSSMGPRPVDRWLAAQPGPGALAQFPLREALGGPALYRTIHHGKPVIFGYGTHIQSSFRAMMPTLSRFPDRETIDLLERLGVRWVVVTPSAYRDEWAAVRTRLGATDRLTLRAELDDQLVFELLAGR